MTIEELSAILSALESSVLTVLKLIGLPSSGGLTPLKSGLSASGPQAEARQFVVPNKNVSLRGLGGIHHTFREFRQFPLG